MSKIRKNEEGFAMLMVLCFASILFIFLAVALNGFFAWSKINRNLAEENRKVAEKITLCNK